jgi:hypothetical protein
MLPSTRITSCQRKDFTRSRLDHLDYVSLTMTRILMVAHAFPPTVGVETHLWDMSHQHATVLENFARTLPITSLQVVTGPHTLPHQQKRKGLQTIENAELKKVGWTIRNPVLYPIELRALLQNPIQPTKNTLVNRCRRCNGLRQRERNLPLQKPFLRIRVSTASFRSTR